MSLLFHSLILFPNIFYSADTLGFVAKKYQHEGDSSVLTQTGRCSVEVGVAGELKGSVMRNYRLSGRIIKF